VHITRFSYVTSTFGASHNTAPITTTTISLIAANATGPVTILAAIQALAAAAFAAAALARNVALTTATISFTNFASTTLTA